MKLLSLVSAFVLGVSAITIPATPNGKAPASFHHPRSSLGIFKRAPGASSRGGKSKDTALPAQSSRFRDLSGTDVIVTGNWEKALEESMKVQHPPGTHIGRLQTRPRHGDGQTGYFITTKNGRIRGEMWYGNRLPGHAFHTQINQRINGEDPANPKEFSLATDAEHKANRRQIQKGMPSDKRIVRDEKPLAKEHHPNEIATLFAITPEESQDESAMASAVSKAIGNSDGVIVKYSNMSPDLKFPADRVHYMRGPVIKVDGQTFTPRDISHPDVVTIPTMAGRQSSSPDSSDHEPPSKRTRTAGNGKQKLADVKTSGGSRSKAKRDIGPSPFTIPSFATPERRQLGPVTGNDHDHANLTEQYKSSLAEWYAYRTATQNEIAALIWPVLREMTTDCRSEMCYEMALSVLAEFTEAPISYEGSFYRGRTSFPQEEARMQANNAPEEIMDMKKFVDAILLEAYTEGYNNATKLLSSSGLQHQLELLSNATNVQDESLLPSQANTVDQGDAFMPFVINHNLTVSWDDFIADINATDAWDIGLNTTLASNVTSSDNSTDATVAVWGNTTYYIDGSTNTTYYIDSSTNTTNSTNSTMRARAVRRTLPHNLYETDA